MKSRYQHLPLSCVWMVMLFCLAGCKHTVSKERAKDYVNSYIEYHNTQLVGGSMMEQAQVAIKDVNQLNDSVVLIHYAWSGIVKAPPLAVPQPDRTVKDEPGLLELHLKNDKWVFTDE